MSSDGSGSFPSLASPMRQWMSWGPWRKAQERCERVFNLSGSEVKKLRREIRCVTNLKMIEKMIEDVSLRLEMI